MKRSVLVTAAAVIVVSALSGSPIRTGLLTKASASSTSPTASSIRFGATTVVDHQRAAGEPGIKVCGPRGSWSLGNCGQNNPYTTAPWGFSTTSSFIWRSEDKGKTYKLVPSNFSANGVTGKPTACPGGGDSDIAVSPGSSQSSDYLNFMDLQGLTNFSDGVSRNGGQTFPCSSITTLAAPVDRQWFGVYKNPSAAPTNGSIVYFDYDVVAGVAAQCLTDPTANGNAFIVEKSTDGGLTWNAPPTVADCNDGIAGNIQVNQPTGTVFAVHTAYSSTTATNTDQVTVNRSTDFGATWTRHSAFNCAAPGGSTCIVGNDFAVLAIDTQGGLYATWSQAPVSPAGSGNIGGPSHIYYAYSGDNGTTWTPEQRVDQGTTDVNVFAWMVAGNAGAIDVVWYGTKKAATVTSYDSGAQTTDWFPYMAQSLNANGNSAQFSAPVSVAQHPNHNGGICTMGIGCTTGGDRSLADFFQVDINSQGAAEVTWADTSNNGSSGDNQGALIDAATQIGGPTLYGGSSSGSLLICRAVTATPCQSDPTGDARYEANGLIGANMPKLDITSSSVNLDPSASSRLLVRLKVANLSALPTLSDLTNPTGIAPDLFVDYLTSWNYHVPGGTQATFDSTGNIYYAYLEVNAQTGTVSGAYDGNTCSIASTHPKYLVYPGQNKITSHIDNAAGTIDLLVPRADVGNPPVGATLYSVTGHTVGQAGPAGPFNCTTRDADNNNQDPAGQVADVYDKTPAYTSILTNATPSGCHEGDGQGDLKGRNGGNAHFNSDEDGCKDGDQDGEQFSDSGANENFQSSEITAQQFDTASGTMTISGIGVSNGLPVTFVIVEQMATSLTPATYAIQLSDGYVNSGALLNGSVIVG